MPARTFIAVLASICCAACGGGGGGGAAVRIGTDPGGGSSVPPTLVNFSDATFADVPSRSYRSVEDNTGVISVAEAAPQGQVDVRVERSAGSVSAITLTVTDVAGQSFSQRFANLSISTSSALGATPLTDYSQFVATGGAIGAGRFIEYADSTSIGYSYVTLGQWASSDGTTTIGGFIPLGFETRWPDIPTTGSARYTGFLAGLYAPPNARDPLAVAANAGATADFANRSIAFATSNSATIADLSPPAPNSGLNLSGTLTYGPSINQFSGRVTSANGMTGTVLGRFYGPRAQEMGGSLTVSGSSGGMTAGFILKE